MFLNPLRLEVVADPPEALADMGKLSWRSRQGETALERRRQGSCQESVNEHCAGGMVGQGQVAIVGGGAEAVFLAKLTVFVFFLIGGTQFGFTLKAD